MKIGPLTVNFARQSAPELNSEVGTARPLDVMSILGGEVVDTSKLKVKDFVKMRTTDGTAHALYDIITMPILSLPWDIKPHPDDVDGVQAKFVEEALKRPPHEGGMTTPMSLVIADMLRAVSEGYRVFEKVYEINADGKIVFRKLASRDNQSITMMTDPRGGFDGVKQTAMFADKVDTVRIPVERCFLFTYGKDKNFLTGESAFIAAYQHFDEKRKLYYLGRLAAQALSIPPKVAKSTNSKHKQAELDAVAAALNNLVGVNSGMVLPEGFDMSSFNAAMGKFDIMGLINHHNAEMARSVLAHFMMLGTGSNTGSWALSQDQTDMFILALKSLVKNLEEHITYYLLPDLVNYNFERPLYPKFEFAEMTDSTIGLMKDIFLKIMDKVPGGIPDYVIEGIVEKLADQLDIEKPDGEKGTANTIGKSAATSSGTPGATPPAGPQLSDRRKGTELDDLRWARPLSPAEERVNFAGLENKYNRLEQDFKKGLVPIWQAMTDDALSRLEKMINDGKTEQLATFQLTGGADYKKLIVNTMLDGYNYAKTGAADELEVGAPATPQDTKTLINNYGQMYVDKQFNDLLFNIRTAINEALRNRELDETQFSVKEVLAAIGAMFAGFLTQHAEVGISAAVAAAVNLGRDDVFTAYEDEIESYEYSAILDRRTCEMCRDLDQSVVDADEYRENQWNPPIHFHCRCIWVAIKKTEEDKPAVTGLPSMPGGYDLPPLSSPVFQFSMQHKARVIV